MKENWLGLVSIQYNVQMMYYRIVHLKPITLLTNVTPINSIKNNKVVKSKKKKKKEKEKERRKKKETNKQKTTTLKNNHDQNTALSTGMPLLIIKEGKTETFNLNYSLSWN